jgi:phage shock protein PspC (stress-responsive transcriptional regulator)
MTTAAQPNLFTRDDTLFGVCEAIGTDFGFNPNWLRAAFALPLIYSPLWTIAAYAALAIIVAISRFAFPARQPRKPTNLVRLEAQAPESLPAVEQEYAHAA